MPITDPNLDQSVIDSALSKTYDTPSVFTQETPYKPFERYKGYKINLNLSHDELENELSKQQSYWNRLSNDLTVAGANAAAMFGSVMMSTKDILSGDFKLDGTLSETQQSLYDWRKSVEESNVIFESDFDREHPILSALLPTALTGFKSTKGWGETILKSGAYGVGAIAAVGLQELAITAATSGTGTIPSLALNVSRLLRLPTEVANAGRSMVNSVKTYSDFRKAYSTVKGSLLAIDSARAAQLGLETTKYLTRGLASAYGEASFEGLESKENLTQSLVKEIEDRYGRPPTPEEMKEIEQKSQEAASMRFYSNIGLLTLTGGYEIGQIFKPRDIYKDLVEEGSHLGLRKTLTKDGLKFEKDVFKLRDRAWYNTPVGSLTKRTVENVGNITKNFKQLDFALMEGVEEFGQLWIDKSTENYYLGRYNNDVNTTVVNSILSGLDDSLNKDGFIAAMSGIMGGTVQSLATREAVNAYKKYQKGEFGKNRIQAKEEHLKNFNERVEEINKTLNDKDVDQLRKAVDINSVGGTLTSKTENTKDQVYTSFLQNFSPEGNIGLETMATFHLIKPFASSGLGSVYKEYLDLQFDESIDDVNERQQLKSFYSNEIDKISKVYNKLNNLYKNPYKAHVNPLEYTYYENWKHHVAGISYTKSKYDDFINTLSPKQVEDSDVFFDRNKFKTKIEKELSDNNKTLETFELVELDEAQKDIKAELINKNKNLQKILDNLDVNEAKVYSEMKKSSESSIEKFTEQNNLSSQEYAKSLQSIADVRFSLYHLTKSLESLVDIKTPEEAIGKMKTKEKEAQDLNGKLEAETVVTPSPEVVEEVPTPEVVEPEEFIPNEVKETPLPIDEKENEQQEADIERRRQEELEYATFGTRQKDLEQGRKNTSEIVNIIKNKYSNNTLVGKIIRLLENLIDFQKFATVRIENLKGGSANGQAMNGGMVLDSLIYDSILEGDSKAIKTFIHEIIHHLLDATKWTSHKNNPNNSNLSNKEIKAWENLERIFEKVKSISKTKAYGLTNLNEFLAEAFSNESFQKDLTEIEGEGKKSNLLKDILNNIVELLQEQLNKWGKRFNKEVPNLNNSILEDVFAWSEDLINIDKKISDASLINEINAKYDAEYVEAVKRGAMTREEAMLSLEEVGRKDSSAYKELTALESKLVEKVLDDTDQDVQKADIRSKFATGLFLLEKNDKGEYVISKDKEKRYNTVQDKVEFLEKLFEGTLDLNDYEVVRVTSEEKSFNTIPMEKGLQFNTSPSYYYSLVKKNSSTLEEITKIQSPDSIVVNPEVIKELNTYKLGIKQGDTILDLARKIRSKNLSGIQKEQVSEIIHSSKVVSQLSLDTWLDKTISHFEAVEKLTKNRNEDQIRDNLFNYFSPYPHVTDFYNGENEYEGDSVPFHYMIDPKTDAKLYKPVAIIEDGEWTVYATNENGDLVELTKDDIKINLNVKNVKSSAFVVVPSFSFDEEISYNTKPLLRTTVSDITDQLVNAFRKDGETGVRDYLRENVRLQSQKITKNPTVFATEKDGKITINIKEDTKPLHNLVLELQEDGSYVLINKDDVGFYPRTTDRLSAYSTLTSKLYKVQQPYSNYRINIVAKPNVVEEPVISVEKTEEMSIDDALASGSLQQVAPTTDAVLQPTDPNSLESLVGKGRTEPITTSTESLREQSVEQQIADIERRRQRELENNFWFLIEDTSLSLDSALEELKKRRTLLNPKYILNFAKFRKADAGVFKGSPLDNKDLLRDTLYNLLDKINAKYDAEYVETVKRGAMTREEAMLSLEEVGRKDSSAYKELTALESKPVENPKTSTISLNYDGNDLTLKKDYEVVDEGKVDAFLKKFTKPEQIAKALPKMLEQNWIKEISKPSERNIKVLTLNIEQQVQEHIRNCHG